MRKVWILSIIVVTAVLFAGILGYVSYRVLSEPQTAANSSKDIPLNANKILELVNAERAKVGVAALVSDPRLVASAQAKADDMVANNYFAHYNPANNEFAGNDYVMNPGLCVYASENIVWMKYPNMLEDNQESVDWWMNSPAHKEAMLSPKYSLTGIGIKDKRVVQHFCQVK